ncbi:GntR family transcriptional regulator [Miniphocaeibacter massiliensis]|uniref:GntR family transcriptional regulator n=1 Tax=Miniphocaeibacter massiliensis TaxID=2041841 RepID=UPI000C1C507A|nr:GntR family transcriptional regulator [Miniphocaeibacter massiliensis]
MKLKKKGKIPLYSQLVDILVSEMELMKPGDKLPSERQLCRLYELSRTTVRQAISELELNGYIDRIHGKGTFVSNKDSSKHNLSDYYSFTEQMKIIGKTPKTTVLEFHIERSNKFVANRLEIGEGDKVIRFVRLREADDIPMMLETTFIPYNDFSRMTKAILDELPLYDIYEEVYDRKIKHVEERFSASVIGKEESIILKTDVGSPCLKIKRLSYDGNGKIIEYTISFARGDQFAYKVEYDSY